MGPNIIIHTMPQMLGEQLYYGGFPLRPDMITVYGTSIKDRFIRVALTEIDDPDTFDKEDISLLEDYLRYYLLAPIWMIEEKDRELVMEMDYNQLFETCFSYGLDPF
jgi:hypothetical protein